MSELRRTKVIETPKKAGEKVKLQGWVDTIRAHGKLNFMDLRDISGKVQCVGGEELTTLTTESVVELIGEVKERPEKMINKDVATGTVEVKIEKLRVLSKADPNLPIPITAAWGDKDTDVSKRFDWRWIDLRSPEKLKIFRVWNALERGMQEYLIENDFIKVYPPSFMNAPSESGADVFEVKYFDKIAYLAQSPQFYKQMALAAGFERVFMMGPVFRAEESYTTRHTTEFTGWDFEMSLIDSHLDVIAMEEGMLVSMFTAVNGDLDLGLEVPSRPFPIVPFLEAKERLAKIGIPSKGEFDVSPEEERGLGKIVKEETGHDFVFLTAFPHKGRVFYHMRPEENPKLTKGFDLLYKGIEVTTGAQREHRVDILEKQAKENGMDIEGELTNYLNFFRYGCPPHGGIGFGPARLVTMLLDLPSVKEATFLPRDVKRLTP